MRFIGCYFVAAGSRCQTGKQRSVRAAGHSADNARAQPASPPNRSNGGTIDKAQQIAAHESPKTTKLYDRTKHAIALDEIERILI